MGKTRNQLVEVRIVIVGTGDGLVDAVERALDAGDVQNAIMEWAPDPHRLRIVSALSAEDHDGSP